MYDLCLAFIRIDISFVTCRKARRKERDAVAASQEESKLYLEQAVLECTVPESRLREVIDLPPGLDYNEWLASHSKLFTYFCTTSLSYNIIQIVYCSHIFSWLIFIVIYSYQKMTSVEYKINKLLSLEF